MLPAIGQLSSDGLLDHAKRICGEVFVFAIAHGAMMSRIRDGYQRVKFQVVVPFDFHRA